MNLELKQRVKGTTGLPSDFSKVWSLFRVPILRESYIVGALL